MIITQMTELINKRIELDPNDHVAIQSIWDKEIEVLTISLDDTIEFINTADKKLLYWSSEVWEDISKILESPKLIVAMKSSASKYKDVQKELINCANEAKTHLL